MYSAEVAAWRRRISKFGEETHSKEELAELVNQALNPPPKKRTWTRHKDKSQSNYHSYPVQVFASDGEFIGEFNSISEASQYTGVFTSQIAKVLKGQCASAKGLIFIRKSSEDD